MLFTAAALCELVDLFTPPHAAWQTYTTSLCADAATAAPWKQTRRDRCAS